jgi:hypothetical protein
MEGGNTNPHTRQREVTRPANTGSKAQTWKRVSGLPLLPFRVVWGISRWIIRGGRVRILFVLGSLLTLLLAAFLPVGLFDRSWLYFDILRRSLLWLVRSTAFRSIIAPIAILAGYGFVYWLFVRKRLFIVVSDFRVWGKLAERFPQKGVEARLRDEIMRLWDELRAVVSGQQPEKASVFGKPAPIQPKPTLPGGVDTGISLPEAHVTLQYQGVSLEAIHTFYRRILRREIVISGDVMEHLQGLALSARTFDETPWEVSVKDSDSEALAIGLRKLALRIAISFSRRFIPDDVNTFVFLQEKARQLEDELVVRLAQLGLDAASDEFKLVANENVALAYNSRGVWLAKKRKYREAVREFQQALDLVPGSPDARKNLEWAYKELRSVKRSRRAVDSQEPE